MPPDAVRLLLNPIVLLVLATCAAVWGYAAARWREGLPVLPYWTRRPVPWRGIDVMLILLAYVFLPSLAFEASRTGIDSSTVAESKLAKKAPLDNRHTVQQALSEKAFWPVALSALMAIVLAPITEELIFRLLLQGWLETVERRLRRKVRWLRHIVLGLVPVVVVATLFAAIHAREPSQRQDMSLLVAKLQLVAVAWLWVVALLICWLKFATGATLADFGIEPRKLASDVRLGLLAFLAVTPPIYAILFTAKTLLPEDTVPDPLPIFFLGLSLGVLYCRTHRIVPSIVLHSAFNALAVLSTIAATH
jgi:membrane protease YdiL (CAAX protease family)